MVSSPACSHMAVIHTRSLSGGSTISLSRLRVARGCKYRDPPGLGHGGTARWGRQARFLAWDGCQGPSWSWRGLSYPGRARSAWGLISSHPAPPHCGQGWRSRPRRPRPRHSAQRAMMVGWVTGPHPNRAARAAAGAPGGHAGGQSAPPTSGATTSTTRARCSRRPSIAPARRS
jgi:hypothetical protein